MLDATAHFPLVPPNELLLLKLKKKFLQILCISCKYLYLSNVYLCVCVLRIRKKKKNKRMSIHYSERDLADVEIDEINELLNKLTPEELEQLNKEVDPDDTYLPAHDVNLALVSFVTSLQSWPVMASQ